MLSSIDTELDTDSSIHPLILSISQRTRPIPLPEGGSIVAKSYYTGTSPPYITLSASNTLHVRLVNSLQTSNNSPSTGPNSPQISNSFTGNTFSYHLHGYHGPFPSPLDDFLHPSLPTPSKVNLSYPLHSSVGHMYLHPHHHTTSSQMIAECGPTCSSSVLVTPDG
eukprot:CAMPEP_0197558220 /NCGR_PEP_ID=MMETSP1320-20131121/18751_1 /TAXON_ID=91990 /ORGANISM="Bolidomonas sp., Strain RCC2347" /LENGTH=165 /DNA_ID=CAMNT_0043119509 /DNA_START=236 /DNA_END=730 /DNA_ORIENTATION=+